MSWVFFECRFCSPHSCVWSWVNVSSNHTANRADSLKDIHDHNSPIENPLRICRTWSKCTVEPTDPMPEDI